MSGDAKAKFKAVARFSAAFLLIALLLSPRSDGCEIKVPKPLVGLFRGLANQQVEFFSDRTFRYQAFNDVIGLPGSRVVPPKGYYTYQGNRVILHGGNARFRILIYAVVHGKEVLFVSPETYMHYLRNPKVHLPTGALVREK